jgi:HNH endonuclease
MKNITNKKMVLEHAENEVWVGALGYLFIRINGKNVPHYQWVWEQVNGPILPKHIVHHKDFNRQNDDIQNLQLLPNKKEHMKLHMTAYYSTCDHKEHGRRISEAKRSKWVEWA